MFKFQCGRTVIMKMNHKNKISKFQGESKNGTRDIQEAGGMAGTVDLEEGLSIYCLLPT